MFETIDKLSKGVEFTCGALTCIPLGVVPAVMGRIGCGVIQIAGGSLGAVANYGLSFFKENSERFETNAKKCAEYISHGQHNLLRAIPESLGLGPYIFIAYDVLRLADLHQFQFIKYATREEHAKTSLLGSLDKAYKSAENIVGAAACIPGLHIVAAKARSSFGVAQIIVGLGGYVLNRSTSLVVSEPRSKELKARAFKCGEYMGHGVLNIVRAVWELKGAGILIFFTYDLTRLVGLHKRRILDYKPLEYFRDKSPAVQPQSAPQVPLHIQYPHYYVQPYQVSPPAQTYAALPNGTAASPNANGVGMGQYPYLTQHSAPSLGNDQPYVIPGNLYPYLPDYPPYNYGTN